MNASGYFPCRDDECDLLGQQASSHERKGARRGTIEPLRVVDDTEQWPLLGGLGQQTEDRQSDEEGARGRPGTQAEGHSERLALRIRQPLEELEARRAQLLKSGVHELHLALDADSVGDPKVLPRLDRVLQQRRLTDARVPVEEQHAPMPAASVTEQPFHHVALTSPAEQLRTRRPRVRSRSRPRSMASGRGLRNSGIRSPVLAVTMPWHGDN